MSLIGNTELPVVREVAEDVASTFLSSPAEQRVAHSRAFAIWAKFLPSGRAEQIFKHLAEDQVMDTRILRLLAKLLRQSKSSDVVIANLAFILRQKLQLPAIDAMRKSSLLNGSRGKIVGERLEEMSGRLGSSVPLDLQGIDLAHLSVSSIRLVATCARACHNGRTVLSAALSTVKWTISALHRLRPLYSEADIEELELVRPGFIAYMTESALASETADADALCSSHKQFLVYQAGRHARLVGSITESLREDQIAFTANKVDLLRSITENVEAGLSAQAVLEAIIRWLTPRLTHEDELSKTDMDVMAACGQLGTL
jgi:hypothetical protein